MQRSPSSGASDPPFVTSHCGCFQRCSESWQGKAAPAHPSEHFAAATRSEASTVGGIVKERAVHIFTLESREEIGFSLVARSGQSSHACTVSTRSQRTCGKGKQTCKKLSDPVTAAFR